jgi:hypothetical protein
MTFLLGEDEALRKRISGITVTDQKSEGGPTPRVVGVWFGMPDQELRSQAYPYITIDMIDIARDQQREMRGKTRAEYLIPEGVTIEEGQGFDTDLPIPVSIDYQVTTYSRHPRHDRELITQLIYSRLPLRFGYLEVTEKSTTVGSETINLNTYRRLEVMDISKRDVTEAGKRLFMNAVTVRVSSEMPQDTYRKTFEVLQVNITPPAPVRGGSFVGTSSTITS